MLNCKASVKASSLVLYPKLMASISSLESLGEQISSTFPLFCAIANKPTEIFKRADVEKNPADLL